MTLRTFRNSRARKNAVSSSKKVGRFATAALLTGAFLATAVPAAQADGDSEHPAGKHGALSKDAFKPNSTAASPYVQASSPKEAIKVLDALQSPSTASASAKAAAGSVKYGPCTLNPTVIYLRSSGGLGAKPYTDCEVPVTSIHQQTDLRYEWWLWWSLADSYTGGNQGEKRYQQRNVQWQCDGDDDTTWAGTTVGTIVYGGETYYARVYQSVVDKPCGA